MVSHSARKILPNGDEQSFFLHDLILPSSQKVLSRLWVDVVKPKSSGEIF